MLTGWVALSAQTTVCIFCTQQIVHRARRADTKCCSNSLTPDPLNLSHFCWFTHQDIRSPNTILLASALLWLSNNWESTVSLKSYTGRHKHSLGGSTTGFVPGPGSGSPSHLGAKSFGPGGGEGSSLELLLLLWQMEGPGEPLVMLGWVGRWPGVAVLLHLRQIHSHFSFFRQQKLCSIRSFIVVMKSVFIFIWYLPSN